MQIKPLFDKVVLKAPEKESMTKGGFFLPASSQEKQYTATVVAVGPGGLVDGKEIKMQVKVGDVVLLPKFAGTEIKLDGNDYVIVAQSEILAIVE